MFICLVLFVFFIFLVSPLGSFRPAPDSLVGYIRMEILSHGIITQHNIKKIDRNNRATAICRHLLQLNGKDAIALITMLLLSVYYFFSVPAPVTYELVVVLLFVLTRRHSTIIRQDLLHSINCGFYWLRVLMD